MLKSLVVVVFPWALGIAASPWLFPWNSLSLELSWIPALLRGFLPPGLVVFQVSTLGRETGETGNAEMMFFLGKGMEFSLAAERDLELAGNWVQP